MKASYVLAPKYEFYARTEFAVHEFFREIYVRLGPLKFFWVDQYHAATMTPVWKTRHLNLGRWSWSGL